MEKGFVLIVTYNRLNFLKKSVSHILDQSASFYKLIVVDNCSNDGTSEWLSSLAKDDTRVIVKSLDKNTGGAGGFCTGLKTAYEMGADWVWGMDDDAFAEINALEKLLESRKQLSLNAAYWSNPNKDSDFNDFYKIVDAWMFVGFFVTREIIEKIGFPREDFFIYYDDIEYARRIVHSGYKIYKIKDSVICHEDAATLGCKYIKVGKRTIEIVRIPKIDWKLYYKVRNELLMNKSDSYLYKESVRRARRTILKALFCGRKLFVAAFRGYIDGSRNITGRIMGP